MNKENMSATNKKNMKTALQNRTCVDTRIKKEKTASY